MSFPLYRRYKDSGVEWLGSVPEHWGVVRLGALFSEAVEEGVDDLPVLSVSIHNGVSDKELDEEELDRKVTRSEDRSKYKRVQLNDLVYNMMRAWQGGFGTVRVEGMVSPAYVVARPRCTLSTRFVEHVLRTPHAVEEMRRHSRGVTDFRLRLYWEEFKNIRVALPPDDEQAQIVDALDRETAKIDALVEEQRRLIELLKEKRQAVISHAVTKGLNPTAPMKDSGVEWLGQVPEHWSLKRLKYLVAVENGVQMGPFGGMLTDLPSSETGFKLYGQENTIAGDFERGHRWIEPSRFEQLKMYALQPGDLVLTRKGSIGNCQVFPQGAPPGIADSDTIRVRLNQDLVRTPFVVTVLQEAGYLREQLDRTKRGAILSGLNTQVVADLTLAVPTPAEQDAIVEFLSAELSRYAGVVAETEVSIALLRERRTALISAAVTGKIDVRGAAPVTAEAA
jgi:type I restriction enzyme S subunit